MQRKLAIGAVDDPLEREADHVADRVMRSAETPSIQRKCDACASGAPCPKCEAEDKVNAKAVAGQTPRVSAAAESSISALRGGGQPLPRSLCAFFEPRMDADFNGVRIHTGAQAEESARAIRARAFTAGRDVAFGAGQYEPGTRAGRRLLAHELAHVVQGSDKMRRQAIPGGQTQAVDTSATAVPAAYEVIRSLFRLIHHNRTPVQKGLAFRSASSIGVVVRRGANDARVIQPPLRLQPIRGSSR